MPGDNQDHPHILTHRRLHTARGDLPPAEYEAIHYRQPQPATTGAET
jgi:putative transposase